MSDVEFFISHIFISFSFLQLLFSPAFPLCLFVKSICFFIFLRLVSVAALWSLVVITSGSYWVCSIAAFSPRVWVIPLCVQFFGLYIGLYVVETLTSIAFARKVLSFLFEQVGSWGVLTDQTLPRWGGWQPQLLCLLSSLALAGLRVWPRHL